LKRNFLCWLLCLVIFASCDDKGVEIQKSLPLYSDQASVTVSSSAAALGQVFFSDPRFSRDGQVACSTCHQPNYAYADTVAFSKGVGRRLAVRNTPTLVGLPDDIPLMWDGGVTPLRHGSQGILAAVTAQHDMDMNPLDLERKLSYFPRYRAALHRLYPHHSLAAGYLLSIRDFVKDIALSSENGIHQSPSATSKLSLESRHSIAKGLALFRGKAGCVRCHHGPSMTDGRFYNLALDTVDPGRAAITLLEEDRGRFRTPPLRMLRKTAPYFHNGSAQSLQIVLQHYINGAGEAGQINLSRAEQSDLIAYMKTL